MSTHPAPRDWRRELRLAGCVLLLGALAMLALGALWHHDLRAPRVVLLGSGNQLSALVTTGNARLLIATGDDPSAFANAVEHARHPTTRRLDVLLVTGSDRGLLAPARIRGDRHVRYAASIGPIPRTPMGQAVVGDGLPVLPSPRRIQLGEDVSVTVETAPFPAGVDGNGPPAWRAIVRRGATVIVILSDGSAASALGLVSPISALVVVGPDPLRGWEAIPAPVLVLPANDRGNLTVSGKDLRQEASQLFDDTRWAIRVHPGEAVPLEFVAGGLAIPTEPAQRLPTTPGPAPDPEATTAWLEAGDGHAARAALARVNSPLTASRRSGSVRSSRPVSAIALATARVFA